MPYTLFHKHFPEIAERETRTVTILERSSLGLPPGHYSLLEMYCDEKECDCRRVFFYVISSLKKDVDAVVTYGWEDADFYAQWMRDDDPEMINELKGPSLNLSSPQSDLAPAILKMVQEVVLQDEAYVERIKNHYRMFRDKIDKKTRRSRKKSRIFF